MMSQHRNRRRCRLIVVGGEYPSPERAHTESGKVVSRDVLGKEGPCRRFEAFASHAHATAPGLESHHCFELRRFRLQPLIQREGKYSPTALWAALDTTVVALANPIELRGIG